MYFCNVNKKNAVGQKKRSRIGPAEVQKTTVVLRFQDKFHTIRKKDSVNSAVREISQIQYRKRNKKSISRKPSKQYKCPKVKCAKRERSFRKRFETRFGTSLDKGQLH